MRARPSALLVLLAATVALAGCIDLAVFPAEIPAGSLAPGWAADSANTQDGAVGAEPLVRAHYHVSAYRDGGSTSLTDPQGPGRAFVISVPDAPIVDEQAEIQKRIDALVQDNGVQVTERSTGAGTVSGQPATFKVFDAQVPLTSGSGKGLALDVTYKCAANGQHVRVFGYAVTEVTGLGRTVGSMETWRELAGDAEGGTLGGMASAVKCS